MNQKESARANDKGGLFTRTFPRKFPYGGMLIGMCKFLYFTTTFLPFWMSTPFWALLTF